MLLKIARRPIAKVFGIIGFLLGLVGGALIGYSVIVSGGLSAESLVTRAIEGFLGLAGIAAGIMMYIGPMRFGGIVAAFAGVFLLIMTAFGTAAILVFVAGLAGIFGAAIKPAWWKFWKR